MHGVRVDVGNVGFRSRTARYRPSSSGVIVFGITSFDVDKPLYGAVLVVICGQTACVGKLI